MVVALFIVGVDGVRLNGRLCRGILRLVGIKINNGLKLSELTVDLSDHSVTNGESNGGVLCIKNVVTRLKSHSESPKS